MFVADALGGWLVGQLADAGRKKLTELVLGSEQERALRRAADVAVWATAEEVSPSGGEQAGQIAMVISEVFRDPVPDAPLARPVILVEGLQAGIAGQLAVLDDAGLTGTGQSSAEVMGLSGAVLADRLTGHLVREIIVRGSGGGPLAPLADQFNHELTRLQIGGMLAQLAAEVRDALAGPGSSVTVAGWSLADAADPFVLEVHRPVEPDVLQPGLPVLPVYVPRNHDAALTEIVTAAAAGTSGMAVLVGGSSTGKTRACWQALELLRDREPGWRLWHPVDPQAAIAQLPGVAPRTVVWLNEAQRYLRSVDGVGEQVAARLRELLRDRTRGPVLVLATLWPELWAELVARPPGGADPHAQARELLTGHNIRVPDAFTREELRELQSVDDPRLAQAAAGSRDRQVIQYMAGAPDLVDRYHNAPPAARALIDIAMDAARLGMRAALPRAFLETAAPGYLNDTEWAQLPGKWLEEALDYTAAPCKGVRGPLAPIRPRPGGPASLSGGPPWQLADYLDQHGRRARCELIPPGAFWDAAASYTDPADLSLLAHAAADRGLLRVAARLYKQASAYGDPSAGISLVRLLHTLHPSDQRPADWAVAHASFDRPGGVAWLLNGLRELGAADQVTALLARDPAAHVSLAETVPSGVASLLDALREAGATGQVGALLARDPAAHVSLDDPGFVAFLLHEAGSGDQVAALLARDPAAHVSLDIPQTVGMLLEQLRFVGATGQVATLLARDPAVHARLDDSMGVAHLRRVLRELGAADQETTLAARAAAHATPNDPDTVDELLDALRTARPVAQVAALANRVVANANLHDPADVARLLGVLGTRELEATGQVATLLARDPAAHVSLDDPGAVAWLLDRLSKVGADGQVATLLARDPAAHATVGDPRGVALLLRRLLAESAYGQVAALASRSVAHVSLDDPGDVAWLLGALGAVGAANQIAPLLARDPAAHATVNDPVRVRVLLYELDAACATGQVAALAARAVAHVSLNDPEAVTDLLYALRRVGAQAQAAALIERLPAAGRFELFLEQEGRREPFRFGRDADGRPARPWAWIDLG